MRRTIGSLFNKKAFDRVFIRQRDEYSCAAAVCATVARLYDLDPALDLAFFRKELRTRFKGTDDRDIEKVCRAHLPVEGMGGRAYRGGIALGFIRHKPDGDEHAVLFLARKNNTLIYYDPYEHRIFRDDVDNMRRLNPAKRKPKDLPRGWTARFPDIPGADFEFWDTRAEDNPYKLREQAFWIRQQPKKYRP